MKKIYVELATLLKQKPEDVEAAFTSEDETAAISLINGFSTNNKIYSNAEFETFVTNTKQNLAERMTMLKSL